MRKMKGAQRLVQGLALHLPQDQQSDQDHPPLAAIQKKLMSRFSNHISVCCSGTCLHILQHATLIPSIITPVMHDPRLG